MKSMNDVEYIYSVPQRKGKFELYNSNFQSVIDHIGSDTVCVTDPPFNIGYKYDGYSDNMPKHEYYEMLKLIVDRMPTVMIHYPEQLHNVSIVCGKCPQRVISWVYNSNTRRQHRDIAFYDILPDMGGVLQPYKNTNDKRIIERIKRGILGASVYDWWNVNQVKNISAVKTGHPCQMPLTVMMNIIGTLPKNVKIFDPFCGSGTTGVAAVMLGHDFIGCDINEQYCDIAKQRLQEAQKS